MSIETYELSLAEALNIVAGATGIKKLEAGDGAYAPDGGIVSIIPVDGLSVTFTAVDFSDEDIASTELFNSIAVRLKSITVTAGACFVGLRK